MLILNRYLTYALCLLFILLSTSCARLFGGDGHFEHRKDEYLEAEDLPPLQIPADLSRFNVSDYYNIPEVPGEPGEVPIVPPDN